LIAVLALGASVGAVAIATRQDTHTPVPNIRSVSSNDTSAESTEASSAPAETSSPVSTEESSAPVDTPSTTPPSSLASPLVPGDSGPDVVRLQERLNELHFEPGSIDGVYGSDTEQAVWAFKQLVLRVPRPNVTSEITSEVWAFMQQPLMIAPRRPAGEGSTHVEIYLLEQVLVVFTDDQAALIAHISTGSGQDYCENVNFDTEDNGTPLSIPAKRAVCASAKTPPGVFKINRHLDGTRLTPIGAMTNPTYFNYGIAIAGSENVPLDPSSHGEVRINQTVARLFPSHVHLWDAVYVWGDDGRQPEDYSKDESLPSFNYPDPTATKEPPITAG
jgi:hypothetical protein